MIHWRIQLFGLLVLSFFILVYFALVINKNGTKDFCQDYISAKRYLNNEKIYHPLYCHDQNTDYVLRYNMHPPFSVFLFIPLALLPIKQAAFIWLILSYGIFYIAGFLLLRELKWNPRFGIFFIFASIFWPPFQAAMYTQNVHQLLLLIFVLAWICYRHKKVNIAAIIIAIGALIKIWPAVLLVLLFPLGHKRASITGFTTIILGVLVSMFLLGPTIYLDYLQIPESYKQIWIVNKGNISLVSFLTTTFNVLGSSLQQAVVISEGIAIGIALAIVTIFWYKTKTNNKSKEYILFSLIPTLVCFLFPIMWEGGLVILLLPCAIIFHQFSKKHFQPRKLFIVVIISMIFATDIVKYIFMLQLYFFKTVSIPSLAWLIMCSTLFFLYIQIIAFNNLYSSASNKKISSEAKT